MAKTKVTAKTKTTEEVGTVVKKVPRAVQVRKDILEANATIENSYVDLSKLLSEAYHKEFFLEWGFTDFQDYCDQELGVAYRKAMYLVKVADCIKEHSLSTKEVHKLGWTKMKELAMVMTAETARDWMDRAKELTTRELVEQVQIARRADGTSKDQVPSVTTMKFTMGESEAAIITSALEEGKKLLEVGDNAQGTVLALEMICQDWMESKGKVPERTKLQDHIQFLERAYGVSIIVTKAQKKTKDDDQVEKVDKKAPTKKTGKVEKKVDKVEKKGEKKVGGKAAKKEEPPPKKVTKKTKPAPEPDGEGDQDLNDLLGLDD